MWHFLWDCGKVRKVTGKVRPRTGHESPEEEYRCSSTLSSTSALDGVGWLAPRLGCFDPRKATRYPLFNKLGGSQGRCRRVRKVSALTVLNPRIVQPVVNRYTDWAIQATWDYGKDNMWKNRILKRQAKNWLHLFFLRIIALIGTLTRKRKLNQA